MSKAVVLAFLPMMKTGKAKVKRLAKLIARRRAKAKATSGKTKSSASMQVASRRGSDSTVCEMYD